MFCVFAKTLEVTRICVYAAHAQMPQHEVTTINPKMRVRVCSQSCVLWLPHMARARARGRLHGRVVLTHLGHFFSKKVGNQNLIWESPGFIWRSPNR